MLFRNAKKDDLNDIYQLAKRSGFGLTTLPADKKLLEKRLDWAIASFNKSVTQPFNEYYFFVLEDPRSKKVIGTSAIEAHLGHDTPFYSYKLSKRTRVCHELNIRSDYEVLNLVNDKQGSSELCTLFLDSAFRHNSNGLLLSKARFLFIAQHPNRFAHEIIAEMRGISNESGQSPFWDSVGYHFFQMPFATADRLTISTNKQFIADLMPRNPIYVKLIDPKAQTVIGKPHASTVPAMNILLGEGFRKSNYIDIFDAGPTIEAPRDEIKTISNSGLFTLSSIIDDVSSRRFLLANTRLDFRATISQAIFNERKQTCILSRKTAQLLQVQCGDLIRISPLKKDNHLILPRECHD